MSFSPLVSIYRSYAKINLYLDVLNKRPDGYNNIETIFQTVSLCDELQVSAETGGIQFTCSNPELAAGPENLAYRAAALLRERSGCTLGARIHLEKRIPIAAGLAGGSGNAAAALIALNGLWDLRWPLPALRELALELGSDVPFCLTGGTAAATQRGENIMPLPPIPEQSIVLAHPPLAVSTAYVYNHPLLERSPEIPATGYTRAFQRAIESLEHGDLRAAVFNRMETAVFSDHPVLAEYKQRLLEAGCIAAAMSGSGPTLFGVCENSETALCAAKSLPGWATSVVCTIPCGVARVQ